MNNITIKKEDHFENDLNTMRGVLERKKTRGASERAFIAN